MNVWGKSERSYRRKNRRGVSPIIATILLVAITVVLAAVLYILIQQYTKGSTSGTPLGSALSFSGVGEATKGGKFWYNVTVETASTGLFPTGMAFQVRTAGNGVVTLAAWSFSVLNLTAVNVATYSGSWTGAGVSTQIQTGFTLSLQTTTNVNGAGDLFVVLGQGSYSGSVQQTIP